MPETNLQRWKSRPIFLSSTFRDMHAERDHLRQHVFPRLEEELLKRRHHLEWIDLRQGVDSGEDTTEEQRELIVLKVCLDEIKRSRPYLIVLLGDRYGWVPPADRLNAAAREAGYAAQVQGHSVTALEIEFGILKETPDQQRRAFFYFREPLPYEAMPPEVRGIYSDQFGADQQAAARWAALEELKKRLTEDEELAPRIRRYAAAWDVEKNAVTFLEWWGQQVFEDLWRELDEETREFAAKSAPTWQEVERDALAEFVEQRGRDFTGRDQIKRQLLDLAKSPPAASDAPNPETIASWGACVTGEPGAGKSALFAKLVSELKDSPDMLLLANAAGTSPWSASVDVMLRRWNGELAEFLNVDDPTPENARVEEVDQTFASLLGRASVKQRVVVLIDALNQFEPTTRAKHMTWCPKLWPPNARLLVTALSGSEAQSISGRPGVEGIALPPLTEAASREICHNIWRRYHCPWSDDVWQMLVAKTLPDGGGVAVANPLWTTLACEQLALLDADDFVRAEREFSGEPQTRLTQLRLDRAGKMPASVSGLYEWLLAETEKVHGAVLTRGFAVSIALSRHGWRESDLRALIPKLANLLFPDSSQLDLTTLQDLIVGLSIIDSRSGSSQQKLTTLQLAALRRSFRMHMAVRGELDQWDFCHDQMREAVRHFCVVEANLDRVLHGAISDHLWDLSGEDPLRREELMFHLIMADDRKRAAVYYGGDLSARESRAATEILAQHLFKEAREGGRSTNARPEGPSCPGAEYWALSLLDSTEDSSTIFTLSQRLLFDLFDRVCSYVPLSVIRHLTAHVREHLLKLPPNVQGQEQWAINLWSTYERAAACEMQQGSASRAFEEMEAGLALVKRLIAERPDNRRLKSVEGASRTQMGTVSFLSGDMAGAIQFHNDALLAYHDAESFDVFGVDRVIGAGFSRLQLASLQRTLGDPANAIGTVKQALDLIAPLGKASSGDLQLHTLVASLNCEMGQAREAQGDLNGALRAHEEARAEFERLTEREPINAQCLYGLSAANYSIGRLHRQFGNPDRALKSLTAGLDLIKRLVARDSSNGLWQQLVANLYSETGQVREGQGEYVGALEAHVQAVEALERLSQRDPTNALTRLGLSAAHFWIGRLHRQLGSLDLAQVSLEAGLGIVERLVDRDPGNNAFQQSRASLYSEMGQAFEAQGDLAGALHHHELALGAFACLTEQHPTNTQWLQDFSVAHFSIGRLHRKCGSLNRALESLEAGLKVVEHLLSQNPSHRVWQQVGANLYAEIAQARLGQADYDGALQAQEQAHAILERLNRDEPNDLNAQRLSTSHFWMGYVHRHLGSVDLARQSLEAGLHVLEPLFDRAPNDTANQQLLAGYYSETGKILEAQEDLAEALQMYRAGLQVRESLAAAEPSSSRMRDLSSSYDDVGDVLQAQGDSIAAVEAHRTCWQIREKLLAADPSDRILQRGVWVTCWRVANSLEKSGDSSAIDFWRRAYEVLSEIKSRDLVLSEEDERFLALLQRKFG